MYGLLLFLHLGGLAVWLGSVVASAFMLLAMQKNIQSADVAGIAQKTIKVYNRITHPSAFLVLLSGILMLVDIGMDQHEFFDFWLLFMEQAGSLIILAFIIAMSIIGKKTVKRIASGDADAARKGIRTFVTATFILVAAILVVIYVVAAKIS